MCARSGRNLDSSSRHQSLPQSRVNLYTMDGFPNRTEMDKNGPGKTPSIYGSRKIRSAARVILLFSLCAAALLLAVAWYSSWKRCNTCAWLLPSHWRVKNMKVKTAGYSLWSTERGNSRREGEGFRSPSFLSSSDLTSLMCPLGTPRGFLAKTKRGCAWNSRFPLIEFLHSLLLSTLWEVDSSHVIF